MSKRFKFHLPKMRNYPFISLTPMLKMIIPMLQYADRKLFSSLMREKNQDLLSFAKSESDEIIVGKI